MNIELFAIYLFFAFILLFASIAICIKSNFTTILASSLFSSSTAILQFFLNAPDVAMTEASIGVFLSTAFALMTLRVVKVEKYNELNSFKLIISLIFTLALTFLIYRVMLSIGSFGNVQNVIEGSGGMHLIISYRDFHIPNTVTTILGSLRSFDTMGETIIVFTSSLGVFMILKLLKGSKFATLS